MGRLRGARELAVLRRAPILPLLIVAALLLFGVKVGDVWQGVTPLVAASPAQAQALSPGDGEAGEVQELDDNAKALQSRFCGGR